MQIKRNARKTARIIRFEIATPDYFEVNKLPDGVEGDPELMCWKELCRTGTYIAGGAEHVIDDAFLQHIVDTFFRRQAKGIEVPCPVGHCHDPEKRRGQVRYVELRKNSEGGTSLYGIIEFVSAEAKKRLMPTSVSIEAPEIMEDGDGEKHHFGLEHVAFTDYPVVAGMEPFEDVVFSILNNTKKEVTLSRKRRFEIDDEEDERLSDELNDEEDRKELSRKRRGKKFADDDEEMSRKRRGKKFADEDEEFSDDEDEELGEDEEDRKELSRRRRGKKFADEDDEFSEDEEFDEDEFTDEDGDKGMSRKTRRCGKRFSYDRSGARGISFSLLRDNRLMKIDAMVRDGFITPQQSRFMKSEYCSDRAIQFSLEQNTNREFKKVCELLEMGVSVDFSERFNERSGAQFSLVGRDGDGSGNALMDEIASRYDK